MFTFGSKISTSNFFPIASPFAKSNKSESAVGYSTLYGDMSGGFAPLKDLWKTQVFELANWRNSNKPKNSLEPTLNIIPETVINKQPTAELRDNQKDTD